MTVLRQAGFALALAASAAAQRAPSKQTAPAPVAGAVTPFTTTSALKATPATITFTAANPDNGSVSGSSTATVSWTVTGGANARTWTLSVENSASTLTNCSTVPASAVKVTCATAGVSGGAGTGACSAAFNLSNALQQVASGKEGTGTRTNTVTINYAFTDSWTYIAHTSPACTATLTYSVTDP
jgi:hypothetical protein